MILIDVEIIFLGHYNHRLEETFMISKKNKEEKDGKQLDRGMVKKEREE